MQTCKIELSPQTLALLDWARRSGHYAYRDMARRRVLMGEAMKAQDPSWPQPRRVAAALALMLQQQEIVIRPQDLLGGHYSDYVNAEVKQDVEARAATLAADPPCPPLKYAPQVQAQLETLGQANVPVAGGCSPTGHCTGDFTAVVSRGMEALAREADQAAASGADADAMAAALRAAIAFAHRHADRAEQLAAQADPARAAQLHRMAQSLRRVPGGPATSFFEALQSAWLTYLLIGLSEHPSSNSWGCVDRYLYPFYKADLDAGRLDRREAADLVAHFLIKAGTCAEGEALTLGGRHADGRDACNELTELFLRVAAELRLPEPVLAFRWHEDLPPSIVQAAVNLAASGIGQPSFYGETTCRAMFATRGVAQGDLDRLALNSCMGVMVAGAELSDMWASVTMLPVAMQLAISGGVTANGVRVDAIASLCSDHYDSIDELFAAYERIVGYMQSAMAAKYRAEVAYHARWSPNPLLSGLLDDCRVRGLDRYDAGPRYHTAIMEAFGWANVGDSLVAIEEIVFRRRDVDLRSLLSAAMGDYDGRPELLRQVLACPKYGNNHAAADAMSRRVLESFTRAVVAQRRPGEHVEFLPSLHTLTAHVKAGRDIPVTLDGRRKGQALNKQLGPSVWAARNGVTAVLASAAAMPIVRLTGGQALDVSLPHTLLGTAEGRQRFEAMLKAYFGMGGSHLQVNTASPDELRAAQKNPKDYGHLVIRIAGYSTYFTWLDPSVQNDLIARIEVGL